SNDPAIRGWITMRWPLASTKTACFARRWMWSNALPSSTFSRRGRDTRRRTSVFLRRACAMRRPSSRGASARTIVSTSGSSGTLDLTPRDVAPPGLAFEGDPLARGGADAGGLRHRGREPGHVQHAPSPGPQRPVWVAERPGVEDQHILAEGLGGGELNRDTLLGMVGVAPGGEPCGRGGVGRCEDGARRPPSAGGDPDQVLTDPGRK